MVDPAKLSALTELAAAPATGDELYIRDISELAVDQTKRITWNNLFLDVDLPGTLDVTGAAILDSTLAVAGDTGIGTTSPNARLEVALDTNTPPTIDADTAALFTQASVTGDNVNISLIAGATGNTRIHFGDTADENIGMIDYDHNSNAMIFVTNTSEQMRIASDGKVGIGSITPVKDLHIASAIPTIRLSDSTAATDQAVATLIEFWRGETTNRVGFWGMASAGNDIMAFATDYAAGEIRFGTGSNVVAMTIDSSQNVGIGDTSPDFLLDVGGDIGLDGTISILEQVAANADVLTRGQVWVRTATPNELFFTDDDGLDGQVVLPANTITLINKTFDANGTGNSITNIENADIAAAAAIAFSKLAALTAGNLLVGNGSNVVTSVNPSGDVDISNAGVFSIAADVIVDADVKSDAAISGSKLQAAGLTNSGAVELATTAETTTGTDATRALTPDGLAGSDVMGGRTVQVVAFDFGTDVTTGDGKFYFVVDERLAGMNIVSVRAKNITAGVTGQQDVQLRNVTAAADILSTKLVTATTATLDDGNAVIDAAQDDLTLDDLIAVDVDTIHSGTAPKGLIIIIGCRLP